MATVVFCVPPMTGPVHASLKLAKELRSHGHRVNYLGLPASEPYISAQGFPFTPVFARWFRPHAREIQPEQASTRLKRIMTARRRAAEHRVFLDSLLSGSNTEFAEAIKELHPDLLIVPAPYFQSFVCGVLAFGCGIPVVYINDTWLRREDSVAPPLMTSVRPGLTMLSKLRVIWAWKMLSLKGYIRGTIRTWCGLEINAPAIARKLAARYGYPPDLIDESDRVCPKLRLPELVLCPQELDFPTVEQAGRYYVEASIDCERRDPSFPWDRIESDKPLIFCTLGSMSCAAPAHYRAFFSAAIEAAAKRPHEQWVVATGRTVRIEILQPLPANVVLIECAPQLKLLEIASVMITHAGTNTIKECALCGVPMILFPLGFDHPGNAARVVYHGLGILGGSIRKVTAVRLSALVDAVQQNAYFRIQARLMSRIFQERERSHLAVELVESLLDKAEETNRGGTGRPQGVSSQEAARV
jgi:zeaxanthin glucosyltransferase